MGLLDSVIGALGQGAGGNSNPQAALISAIVGMLMQGGGAAGQGGGSGASGGLGGILGSALGGGGGGGLGGALGSALGGALGGGAGGSGGGMGGLGGLAGLVEQFSQHGMGDIAKSWVGGGQNMPVSPDQLGEVFGNDMLAQLSRQLGMNQGDLLGQMSQVLPQVVDQLTPKGQIPDGDLQGMAGGDIGSLLGGLLGAGRR
ncbi:MAG: DUF937 domain-containing protein [Betaproteobacteria bacterium]|nr:DUF937 domain-containing protein [Betaproteobacteria bacterium]